MNSKSEAMLKAFVDHTEHKEELLSFFPSELSHKLTPTDRSSLFRVKDLFSSLAWAAEIHFSWFPEMIQHYPPALRPYFLDLLTQKQARGINEILTHRGETPIQSQECSPFLRPLLAHLLRSEVIDPEIKARQHLPTSPLNILLDIDRRILIHLCDLLGIYDLAADLRQVIEKQLLGKIHSALTPEQLHFLHYSSRQPMKWVPPKLGLSVWDGSKKQLNDLLHYRGLLRLAKAISHEDLDFKWHLLHRFDVSRARIIQKELYQKQDPSLSSYFKNQVLHIAQRAHSQHGEREL